MPAMKRVSLRHHAFGLQLLCQHFAESGLRLQHDVMRCRVGSSEKIGDRDSMLRHVVQASADGVPFNATK